MVVMAVSRRTPLEEAHSRLAFNVEAYGTAWTGEMADTEFIVRPLIDEADRLREALKRIAAGEARPSHIAGRALDDARGD